MRISLITLLLLTVACGPATTTHTYPAPIDPPTAQEVSVPKDVMTAQDLAVLQDLEKGTLEWTQHPLSNSTQAATMFDAENCPGGYEKTPIYTTRRSAGTGLPAYEEIPDANLTVLPQGSTCVFVARPAYVIDLTLVPDGSWMYAYTWVSTPHGPTGTHITLRYDNGVVEHLPTNEAYEGGDYSQSVVRFRKAVGAYRLYLGYDVPPSDYPMTLSSTRVRFVRTR